MQNLAMHKTDSTDFTSRVKLLLELMINNSAQETKQEKENVSDASDTENEDTEDDNEPCDLNFRNARNSDRTVLLNRFFEDRVRNGKKIPATIKRDNIWDNYQFEKRMYRVIPVRLDKRICNSGKPTKSSKR